jgi:hypothetical protein
METTGNYRIPTSGGDLDPKPGPTVPMPVPRTLTEGGENIAPPDGGNEHSTDNTMPATARRYPQGGSDVTSTPGVGAGTTPLGPGSWSGSTSGPMVPSSPSTHPALR